MSTPTISVIIPVYNAEKYVVACLESVLAQHYLPTELILINDGSTDRAVDQIVTFLKQSVTPTIQLRSHANQGLAQTLNEGIRLATGDLLAFQDADDLWAPDKLTNQVACLLANPNLDACFGFVQQFISPDLPAEVQAGIACPDHSQPGWLKQTMLIRRAAFAKTGLFNPTYHVGDFIDWFIRAKEAGLHYTMIDKLTTYRRLHRSGLVSQTQYHHEFAHILKAALDRRVIR